MLLSHDRSCNLSCSSCRREILVADKDEVARLNELFESTLAPLLREADSVHVTGRGTPSARALSLRVETVESEGVPAPAVDAADQWRTVRSQGMGGTRARGAGEQRPGIDRRCDQTTYSVVRRGGSFERLLDNLAFIAELRRERRIGFLGSISSSRR